MVTCKAPKSQLVSEDYQVEDLKPRLLLHHGGNCSAYWVLAP